MNLLITGAWNDAKDHFDELEKMGHHIEFLQFEKEALPCPYEWVEGVICNGLFLFHAIEKFANLKYIQLTSAGFDRVPMEYVQEHQIEIHNAKGVYSIPMAEFALFGVLELYKQGRFFMENQKQHRWEKHRELLELHGKRVCIIGCGNVGTECAKRFRAFECVINGIDLVPRNDDSYEEVFGLDRLEEILTESDIVVLTLPLTDQTRHLIDGEKLKKMKLAAILVNIARGAIVDTEALIQVLPNLGGVILDVFEEEPLEEESILWDMENVIVTPHNSFVGDGNRKRLNEVILGNLEED